MNPDCAITFENQGPDPEPWEFFYVGADNLAASATPADP